MKARHSSPGETAERRLDNGLTVLARRIAGTDVAAVVTRVAAGYFDETDEDVGISHVLEHMYFKGTARRGPGDIGREVREAGGVINAGTGYDRTTYYAIVPAEAVHRILDIHADALLHPVIDADELARELRVIIEEARRKCDTPRAVAQESLYAALFDRHRMRRWRIGTEEALATFDAARVRAFHEAHYRPANVVLSIAGAIDPDEVLEEADRLFGEMPTRDARRDRGPAEPERHEFRYREMSGPSHRDYIHWGWRTQPPLHADSAALDLLAVVLGQGRASRLYRGVRETGRAQDVGASQYAPTELGVFTVSAVAAPGESGAALDAITGVLRAMREKGPDAEETERAKRMVEARVLRHLEVVNGQASLMADWQSLGDWRLFDAYLGRLSALTRGELRDAADHYLDPGVATVLVYRAETGPAVAWSLPARGEPGSQPAAAEPVPEPASVPAAARPTRVDDDLHVYEHGTATIVVLPRSTAPLVTIAFAYGAGESEEPPERTGLTGLVMRTSLKGTPTRDAAAIADRIESVGGVVAAGAGADMFEWSLGLPARHFDAGFDILADIALRPAFPEPELETERKAALGELEQLRDSMVALPYRLMMEAAFEGHRYGATLDALDAGLRNAAAHDLAEWHEATVRRRSALILVVGDVDPDTAAALVMSRVPAGTGGGAPEPALFAGLAGPAARVVERATAQTALALGFPGPPRNEPDADALRVLAAAVGGLGGRLVEELRSRRSLAYTVSATPVTRSAAGLFVGYIATSPEREEEARTGMLEELGRLAATRLPDADIDRARRYLVGSRRIRLQTHSARLAELARALRLGRGIDEIRDWEARILAQDPESVRSAAARWLDPARVAEGIVRGGGAPKATS